MNKICSICRGRYTGFGNNAWPVNEGECCDACNSMVIGARVNQLVASEKTERLVDLFDRYEAGLLEDV